MPNPRTLRMMNLEFPQSLAVYPSYAEAQSTVDYLSDEKFPVQNLAIVGTDLKMVERVLGRKSWGLVLFRGALNGFSMGLLFGLMWMLFTPDANAMVMLASGVVLGMLVSMVFGAIGHAATGGQRDFQSVQQIVATRYEVLCEHRAVEQARALLAKKPGERSRSFG